MFFVVDEPMATNQQPMPQPWCFGGPAMGFGSCESSDFFVGEINHGREVRGENRDQPWERGERNLI